MGYFKLRSRCIGFKWIAPERGIRDTLINGYYYLPVRHLFFLHWLEVTEALTFVLLAGPLRN